MNPRTQESLARGDIGSRVSSRRVEHVIDLDQRSLAGAPGDADSRDPLDRTDRIRRSRADDDRRCS